MIKNHPDINVFEVNGSADIDRMLERPWSLGVWLLVFVAMVITVLGLLFVGNIVIGLN